MNDEQTNVQFSGTVEGTSNVPPATIEVEFDVKKTDSKTTSKS